jgi:DNA-binding response OmpR family regulator
MIATQYRALVVDDEPMVRQGTMRALSRNGFSCESASDGVEALTIAKQSQFDVIVTDLRMPEGNGHQLAVELLGMSSRPAVVVLTGVIEPKLANDLRLRGVEEILFKPIEYEALATKVRLIVDQRTFAKSVNTSNGSDTTNETVPADAKTADDVATTVFQKAIAVQLAKASGALKSPPASFDAFARGSANIFSATDLAKQSSRIPVLCTTSFALLIDCSTGRAKRWQTCKRHCRRGGATQFPGPSRSLSPAPLLDCF